MIYVPDLQDNYFCYSFIDSNTIRAYKSTEINSSSEVVDIYINSHYLLDYKNIVIQDNINCINNDRITNDWKYRNDIVSILLLVCLGLLFFVGIPFGLLKKILKRSVL